MLYLCTASMFAQIRGNEIRVVVSPDHSDWTYRLKEKCTFTIQVYKAQNVLPDVKVDYELGPEWYPTEKKDGVSLKDGKLTVSSSMNTPGFLRCKSEGVRWQQDIRRHGNRRIRSGIHPGTCRKPKRL